MTSENHTSKHRLIKLGIFLMIFSGVFFAISLIIPFLELETKQKIVWSSASLIIMEIVFWAGGLLVGKELFSKYKSHLNPVNWFNRKNQNKSGLKDSSDIKP